MIHSRKKFTILFWTLFVIMYSIYSFVTGTIKKDDYIQVTGKVTNQVATAEHYMYNGYPKSKEVIRPEITYPTADGNMTRVFNKSKLSTGKSVQILYSKTNPADARIYNFLFWINYSVLIPAFLIACFIFSVALVTINKYEKKAEILPGELDPFVYREPEKLTVD
jgi:hypothetical protein